MLGNGRGRAAPRVGVAVGAAGTIVGVATIAAAVADAVGEGVSPPVVAGGMSGSGVAAVRVGLAAGAGVAEGGGTVAGSVEEVQAAAAITRATATPACRMGRGRPRRLMN